MKNSTKNVLLDLAYDITRKNLEKGLNKPKRYQPNKSTKPKVKSKNKIIKTPVGVIFHVRDNMSGTAFKNMIIKNEDAINDFIESDEEILKL